MKNILDYEPKHNLEYCISSINTAPSINATVWYYLSTNNIELSVYFNSSTPLNNTACQYF